MRRLQLHCFDFFLLNFFFADIYGQSQASQLQPVQYDKPPNYLRGGRRLSLKCSVPIGDQPGQLVWELLFSNKTSALWSVSDDQKNLNMKGPPKNVTAIALGEAKRVASESGSPSGYSIESTLHVRVNSLINESSLTCMSLSKFSKNSSDKLNGMGVLRSQTKIYFNVVFFLKRPELVASVHDDAKSLDIKGVCQARCLAHVGLGGVLTWTLVIDNQVLRWTLDVDGKLWYDQSAKQITRIYNGTAERSNVFDGPVLIGILDLYLSYRLQNALLSCYAYNVSDEDVLNNTNDPYRSSYRIEIHHVWDIFSFFVQDLLFIVGIVLLAIALVVCCLAFRRGDVEIQEDDGMSSSWSPGMEPSASRPQSRRNSVFSFRNVLHYFRRTSSQASSVGSEADDRSLHSRRRLHFKSKLSA